MSRSLRGLVVIVLGFVAGPCWATNKDWNDGSDNWSNAALWTPAGVPGAGDTVNISFSDDVARTVSYDYTGPAITLGFLNVDMMGAGTNASTFSMSAILSRRTPSLSAMWGVASSTRAAERTPFPAAPIKDSSWAPARQRLAHTT